MILNTSSELETKAFAQKLAGVLKNSSVIIALSGELGAGKTIFAQGFAQGLEIKDKVLSPTFILIKRYSIPNSRYLFHIDLYRLSPQFDHTQLGLEEILNDKNAIVLIEWAEKLNRKMLKKSVKIRIDKTSETTRKISISNYPKFDLSSLFNPKKQ